jgi:predicted nucleotidyltransferase
MVYAELKLARAQAVAVGVFVRVSFGGGEGREDSDVDILIVLDRIDSYGAEIERTNYLVSDRSLEYGVSVSRVFVAEADWRSVDSPFLENVREEAIAA